MKRYLEPWWFTSNPFVYDANNRARIVFPPVPQRTWNVLIGFMGVGLFTSPSALWKNIVRSIVINENEHIIGPGCPLALIGSQGRVAGPPATDAFAPPAGLFPNTVGFSRWPGDFLELYDGTRVCGAPYLAQSTITVIVENIGVAGADELQQLSFAAVELPEDSAASNFPELKETWEKIQTGLGGVSFSTHEIFVPPPGGIANFQDPTVLTTWHNFDLRRTDLRGGFLQEFLPGLHAPDENAYLQATINTRSDRSRDVGVGFTSAPLVAGMGGEPNSSQFPLDFRSNGEDREIITANSPNFSGNTDRLYFCGIMEGIQQREYFGRVAGQAY